MELISPSGVRLSVSDDKGERLKLEGYTEPQSSAAPSPSPVKRTRRKTAAKETEDGVRDSC